MHIQSYTIQIPTDTAFIHAHTCCNMHTCVYRIPELALTYYGVSTHLFADHSCIAAQKYWHGRAACTSKCLGNLIHFAPVDGSILALTVSCVDHLKLRVLLSGKSTVAGKLFDRIVQRPEEKHHALTAVCFLGKIPAHYPCRNIQVDSFRSHGPHLSIVNSIRPKLGVGGPF